MAQPKPNPPRFLELLKEVYDDEEREKQKEVHSVLRHYPSSASFKESNGKVVGACLRALYYRATHTPESDAKELTVKLQGDFGNGIHDRIQAKLQKSKKIKLQSEARGRVKLIGLDGEISYRLDGLVNHQGEMGGLEIKTMQSYGLQKMVKEEGPKKAHILQVLSYFHTDESLRWFSLVYFGRDTAYRAEYHIYKDPETGQYLIEGVFPKKAAKPIQELTAEGVVARWKELEKAVADKKVPQRDFKAVLTKDGKLTDKRTKNYVEYETDYACRYCNYRTMCWSLPDAKDEAYKVPGD